ncbi:MAG TPA: hypothetical protein VHN11_01130 [Xanthobacteraceae bacterium]|nr:hypothetical protein [Xanthobacteraceae bacterium]
MPSTIEQLRREIDEGRTGDKIPNADPAASPLGSDEEAAGTQPSAEEVDHATKHEITDPQIGRPNEGVGAAWVLFGFIGLLAAVMSVAALFRA